jgi:hypothetical protein
MVLIESPATGSAGEKRSGPPPLPRPAGPSSRPVPTAGDAANLADTVDDPTLYGTVDPASEELPGADGRESTAVVDGAARDEPVVFAPDEEATVRSPWRSWLLVSAAAVVGVILAMATFVWLSRPRPAHSPSTSVALPPTSPDPPGPAASPSTPPDKPSMGPPMAERDVKPPVEEAPPKPEKSPTESPPLATDHAAQKPPLSDSPPAAKADAPTESKTPAETEPSKDAKADAMTPGGSLRATLKAFGALLDEPAPAKPPEIERVPTPKDKPEESPPEKGRLLRPPPRQVDVAARLDDKLNQLEFKEVPFSDFLQFVSDFSSIPVTLDPDVLPWLRLTPSSPVTALGTDATVGTLLGETLPSLGLNYVVDTDQLFVTRVPPEGATLREIKLDVRDLTGGDPVELEELRAWITELVSPETWVVGGGEGSLQMADQSLVARQRDDVLFRVFALVEKLRVARGLSPQSRFDARLFQLQTRVEQARPVLQHTVSLSYVRPTSFVRVLSRMGKDAGAYLLVDWRAAARAGWNPDAEVVFVATNQPLSDALRMLLGPMDLAFRIVNENTLQVTTPEELETRLDLEFFAAADLLSAEVRPDQLLNRIRGELGESAFRERGGSGVLRFDEKSKHILASLPQPQQLSLSAILARIRNPPNAPAPK